MLLQLLIHFSYAQPQPQWNAPHQGWRPQYNSHSAPLPPPPTQPQPSPPPPPRQPQMPAQPQPHPHLSQIYTPTQLPVPPFPNLPIGAAQHNCNAETQHVQITLLELNDLHHSLGRVLQSRDYIDNIEGPKAKEDSKEEIKPPWAALDEEKTSEAEIKKAPSWLPSNPPCSQEKNQQKGENVRVMIEGDTKNDLDQQKDQGYQSYIEIWFQTVTKLQRYSLPQLCLIPSKSDHLVSEIRIAVKGCISSLHIILSLISMCTWLHWKYSYT